MTTTADIRRALADRFRGAGLDSPDLDARILTGFALGLDHAALASAARRPLSGEEMHALDALVERRLQGEPVARITGVKEFWGLQLEVSAATLVPRPETETLVETALTLIDAGGSRSRALSIADLGTGTGALLLALLSELPNAHGVATDISAAALDVARRNAYRHKLAGRASFVACNFGTALAGGFDLVVVNPPYIASSDIPGLAAEVHSDPIAALDGGPDGLSCYRVIAADARRFVAPMGHLVVELGIGQECAVTELFQAAGLESAPAQPDLSGIPRALSARVAAKSP